MSGLKRSQVLAQFQRWESGLRHYSGFAEVGVCRPLVAISQANFADPEVWKPTKLPSEIIAALRQQFRKKFRSIDNCRNLDENVLKPWLYREDDISISKVYCSQKGWFVAEMKRAEYRSDGPIAGGGPFDAQWYVVEPTGAIRFLDSGMRLVDAGDYDRDGKSELLFSINRYGIGGYELLLR